MSTDFGGLAVGGLCIERALQDLVGWTESCN